MPPMTPSYVLVCILIYVLAAVQYVDGAGFRESDSSVRRQYENRNDLERCVPLRWVADHSVVPVWAAVLVVLAWVGSVVAGGWRRAKPVLIPLLVCLMIVGAVFLLFFGSIYWGAVVPARLNRWPCYRILDLPENDTRIVELHCQNAASHGNTFYLRDQKTGLNIYRFHQPASGYHYRVDALRPDLFPANSTNGKNIGRLRWKFSDSYHFSLALYQPYLNITSLSIYVNTNLYQARLTVNDDDHHHRRIRHLWALSHPYMKFKDGKVVLQYSNTAKPLKICMIQSPDDPLQYRQMRQLAFGLAAVAFTESGF